MPVGLLIATAYGFEIYQFRPSDPCCRGRYDVNAKVPQGATTEQFHQMMRNLLKDRFQLKLHHEKKNMTVYELAVALGGPKLKHAAGTSAPEDPWALPEYSIGKDGYPIFPAGRGGLAGPNGNYRWVGYNVSMQKITKTLSSQLGGPVIDATGLAGAYDMDLRWQVDSRWALERAGIPQEEINALGACPSNRARENEIGAEAVARIFGVLEAETGCTVTPGAEAAGMVILTENHSAHADSGLGRCIEP